MAASPRASLRSSALCRVVLILLPAFYCSWTAFRLTLRLTLFRSEINGNDGQFSRTADAWNAQLRTSFDAAKYDAIDARARSRVVESDENECFPLNSIDWLEGPRHGNSDEEGLSFGSAPELMPSFSAISSINNLRSVLQQSLCHNQSALLSLDSSISLISEERAVHLWTARLLYLVVYEHQHRPAFPEAEARSKINAQCMQAARENDICSFDFECPSAKFLVVSFYKNGIGANMRLGAVPALEAGIASGRVVVFVDDAATGPAFLQEPWTLASCDHRRDAQCFFRAATPCVLTANELASAYTLKKGEMRRLFRHGLVPDDRVDDRVLILHLSFRPQRQPENLRTVLHNRSTAFIERLVASDANLVSPELLYKAADAILHEEASAVPRTTKFNYYGAGSQIFHSLLLYAMRPNPGATAKMDAILHEVIPDDFSATSALGLPIRASDKCDIESECLSFDQYMAAAKALWVTTRSEDSSGDPESTATTSVVVTSESKLVLSEQANYTLKSQPSQNESFVARFITNHRDVAQDTGYLEDVIFDSVNPSTSFTADQAMLSAISSLKLQLLTSVTVGNCCSNFHLLLKDLLDSGCGASFENKFQCLQDHENPEFRVCCAWDRSAECQARRQRRIENLSRIY